MDQLTGKAHLRMLGYKRSHSWGTTHMAHPHTKIILYFDYSEQKWFESNISFGPIPTETLRVLNNEL